MTLKSIRFNLDDEEDRKLYEWLSHLKRGEFTEVTKSFWTTRMKSIKESEREAYIQRLREIPLRHMEKMKEGDKK